jgi:ELWxxDGT repeat protein
VIQGSAKAVWSTDGTAAGTRLEYELPEEIRFQPLCQLTATANGLVFSAGYSSYSSTLWRTNGSAAGTVQLRTIGPVSGPNYLAPYFTAIDGAAYLFADDHDAGGIELWRTDGSEAGTVLVADLTAGAAGALSFAMDRVGPSLVFAYRSQPGTADGLYRVAAPGAPAERIKAGAVGSRVMSTGARAFFTFNDAATHTESLWATDGTSAGTREVFNPGAGQTLPISAYLAGEGRLYFYGPVDSSGPQLWFTTGEPGVKYRLSNLPGTTANFEYDVVVLDNRPLFSNQDDVRGAEPWMMVNQPPVAAADGATVVSGSSVLIAVRANDADPDSANDIVTAAIVAQPAHGTLVAEGAGYRYTSQAAFVGADTFTYQLTDELGAQSAVATVSITISAVPPSGGSGGAGGKKSGGGAFDLLALAGLLVLLLRRLSTRGSRTSRIPAVASRTSAACPTGVRRHAGGLA